MLLPLLCRSEELRIAVAFPGGGCGKAWLTAAAIVLTVELRVPMTVPSYSQLHGRVCFYQSPGSNPAMSVSESEIQRPGG